MEKPPEASRSTTTPFLLCRLGLIVALATYPWLEPRPGSMGKPTPGYDLDLLREDGQSCEVGEEGEIVVRTGSGRPPGI